MAFFHVRTYLQQASPNDFDEHLLQSTLHHGPQAIIWQGQQGLVVPRTYAQHPRFKYSQEQLQALGWPLTVRQSGGGVVPQGHGIWNISLAWRQYGRPLDLAGPAYALLCRPLQKAFADVGIKATTQAVEGSFCDGRYNLAVWHQHQAKKIVGTAQVWRRCAPPLTVPPPTRQAGDPSDWHVVLCHALVLIHVDHELVTHYANLVEQTLERTQRYQAQRIVSLNTLNISSEQWLSRLQYHLRQQAVPHDQASPSHSGSIHE